MRAHTKKRWSWGIKKKKVRIGEAEKRSQRQRYTDN